MGGKLREEAMIEMHNTTNMVAEQRSDCTASKEGDVARKQAEQRCNIPSDDEGKVLDLHDVMAKLITIETAVKQLLVGRSPNTLQALAEVEKRKLNKFLREETDNLETGEMTVVYEQDWQTALQGKVFLKCLVQTWLIEKGYGFGIVAGRTVFIHGSFISS